MASSSAPNEMPVISNDEGGRGSPVEVRRQVGDAQLVMVARRRDDKRSRHRGNAIANMTARARELLRQRAVVVEQRERRDDRRAVADMDFELMRDLGGPRPVAQLGHAQGEAVERGGERHPKHERPLVAFERGGIIAERHQRVATMAMRPGIVGCQQERRIEALECLLVLPQRTQRDAAIDEHARAGGRECKGTVIAFQRFGVASERQQRVTPVVEGGGIGGLDRKRAFVTGERLGGAIEPLQRDAAAVERGGVVGAK
jgi:hypothetical protein